MTNTGAVSAALHRYCPNDPMAGRIPVPLALTEVVVGPHPEHVSVLRWVCPRTGCASLHAASITWGELVALRAVGAAEYPQDRPGASPAGDRHGRPSRLARAWRWLVTPIGGHR